MQATRIRPGRTLTTLLLSAGLVTTAGGCAAISQAVPSNCPDDGIQFGVEPQAEQAAPKPAYTALRDALTEELDCPVTVRVFDDRAHAVQALVTGQVELAHLTPVGYARAANEADVAPVATFGMPNGNMATYTVGIWVPADSGITAPAHLEGHTLALGAQGSTSGDAIPRAALTDSDLEAGQLSVQHTGGSDAALAALTSGQVDAAAFTSGTLTRATSDGTFDVADHRMIWESGTVPNDPIVLAPGRTDDFARAASEALLGVDAQAVAPVGALVGVDPGGHLVGVSKLDYTVFLDLLR